MPKGLTLFPLIIAGLFTWVSCGDLRWHLLTLNFQRLLQVHSNIFLYFEIQVKKKLLFKTLASPLTVRTYPRAYLEVFFATIENCRVPIILNVKILITKIISFERVIMSLFFPLIKLIRNMRRKRSKH